jgi:hypothetical protein
VWKSVEVVESLAGQAKNSRGAGQLLMLVVSVAATRRMTRIVTKDEIAAPIRDWAFNNNHKKLTYLVNCPHCVSVWAGFLVTSPLVPASVKWGLALSELTIMTTRQGEL